MEKSPLLTGDCPTACAPLYPNSCSVKQCYIAVRCVHVKKITRKTNTNLLLDGKWKNNGN